jgi:CorA-like Mg2+ transporter protein.
VATTSLQVVPARKRVRQFRQVVIWPLQLMPVHPDSQIQRHWEVLERKDPRNPWREVVDEFMGDPGEFRERDYNEFTTFLPHVQRFLYGEGRARRIAGVGPADAHASPMRIYRRVDVTAVRLTPHADAEPRTFSVTHVDLYFFYDIDIVLLTVGIAATDLSLYDCEDTMYRFARAYPAEWEDDGEGLHCMHRVEWLGADGTVLAVSDTGQRQKFLSFVSRHRLPRISAHWAFLLQPLVLDQTEDEGVIRYRLLEYYRMPLMTYLAVDEPRSLSRDDFVRLGLITAPGSEEPLPYSDRHLADFEDEYCYDRFWDPRPGGPTTRYLCCGHALVVVGDASSPLCVNAERSVLSQFRHQHFMLFLIAHFQRAALLMFSNRLVHALNKLEIHDAESVKQFKRSIRQNFEIFLRFTHRYWFHDVADQALAKALFRLTARHLALDSLYAEIKERIYDMSEYLDSDSLRRQGNTVLRLTVVTTFGLIGTIVTGFLGMNLIADAGRPFATKVLFFILVLIPTVGLTLYTIVKSKALSDLLESLADERLSTAEKYRALVSVWRRPRAPRP